MTHVALTNSEGIGKVLQFNGLGLKITVLPTLETYGEPTITKQAIYFLQDLEAAAKVRVSADSTLMEHFSENEQMQFIIYILDNYLFVYSLFDERSKITSKAEKDFLEGTINKRYRYGDKGHVKYLMVDTLNDDSVISCKDTTDPKIYFQGTSKLVGDYFDDIYNRYVKEIENLFSKKVLLKTKTSEEILPVLKFVNKPFRYNELVTMSNYVNYVEENDPV